ncbi:hypothetical protein AWC19_23710 [Mycobacterium palustre]|uniref:Uncharacterized protein n=1 Tax=Mycobacterium palustre TaxID=153971 RepID=A0A1X2A101_9MYCO|nr:hypothetical protein AWC19_23710 [Mycobacterium palustre]
MDHDDAERRIASGAPTAGGWLTAEQVHNTVPRTGARRFAPPTAGPLAARHGSARHAVGETWLGRARNVAVGFVARIIEDTP